MNSARAVLGTWLGVVVALAAACDEGDQERRPLPDWSDGYETDVQMPDDTGGDPGEVDPPVGIDPDTFSIAIPEDIDVPVWLARRGTFQEPCEITPGSADNDIECVMDFDELDLHVLGFRYIAVAPEGMCDFVLHSAPFFEAFAIGRGPDRVAYTVHEDGSYSDEVNSANGEPQCEFDYRPSGPNCCSGSYLVESMSAMTGMTTTFAGEWGTRAELSECLDGGAFYAADLLLDEDGYPHDLIVFIDRDAYMEEREFSGLSDQFYGFNYPLANYYDPADHEGGDPAPFAPGAVGRKFYAFECLDDAGEIIARIRLTVREWNEEREFDRYVNSDDGAVGNSDTDGFEEGWEQAPINDLLDWKDVASGQGQYPNRRRPTSGSSGGGD